MSLRDVLRKAMEEAGIPIPDKNFIKQYNRAIHDLAMMYDTAKKSSTQSIVCADIDTEYSLTAGVLKIERILDSEGCYYKYFKVRNHSKVLFSHLDTFTVYELFDQDPITTMDSTEAINTIYNTAIAKYIAAREIKKADPDTAQELMNEYYAEAARANMNIKGCYNPVRKAAAPRWR
jgi:hypothetical protein